MRALPFLCLALLSACRSSSGRDAAPEVAALEDCTLQTPLVPGVPGSPGHLIPSELNPNGASELATLMRSMVADMETAGAAVDQGQPLPKLWSRHRRLRCSWPTAQEDRNAAFDSMAVTYLAQVQALDATPKEPKDAFNAVVESCRACHDNTCSGPVERIMKLRRP